MLVGIARVSEGAACCRLLHRCGVWTASESWLEVEAAAGVAASGDGGSCALCSAAAAVLDAMCSTRKACLSSSDRGFSPSPNCLICTPSNAVLSDAVQDKFCWLILCTAAIKKVCIRYCKIVDDSLQPNHAITYPALTRQVDPKGRRHMGQGY